MNIEKKVNIIMFVIFILTLIIYYIFYSILMKNDYFYFWYINNKILFYFLNYIFIIIFLIIIERKIFKNLYKKYIDILNNALEPEKFIKLTEIELKKSKRPLYKNYLKMNLIAGYSALNKIDTAAQLLEEIDLKNKKRIKADLKLLYYYNKSLFSYILNKEDEAKKVYENTLEILNGNKNKLIDEMKIRFDILKYLIYDEDNIDEIIKLYEKIIKISKEKITIIFAKYNIAEYKEKKGNTEEALRLYKEVAETGNRLYITEKSKEKIEKLCKKNWIYDII